MPYSSQHPLHWQQQVHEDLLRDEALGVIERVPYGEPVTWFQFMRRLSFSLHRLFSLFHQMSKFCTSQNDPLYFMIFLSGSLYYQSFSLCNIGIVQEVNGLLSDD
jgi:hypothetical protein